MKQFALLLFFIATNCLSANNSYYEQLLTKKFDNNSPSKIDPKKLDISICQKNNNLVNVLYLYNTQKVAQLKHHISRYANHDVVIDEISVCKKYRGQGIGTHILKEFLKIARDHGYLTCSLCAMPLEHSRLDEEYKKKLKKLIKWYESFGFQIIEQSIIEAEMQKDLQLK